MTQKRFLSGDRVKYVGNDSPWLQGLYGSVVEQTSLTNVRIAWDGPAQPDGVRPENLQLISRRAHAAGEIDAGAGSVGDPLHEALQRLIKAKRAHKAAERAKSAAYKEEARAKDMFNKALADAAKE